jgi:hypothetical protein
MKQALLKNQSLILILLLNLISGIGLLGAYYQSYASESPASNPLVWIAGVFIVAHIVTVIVSIRSNHKREAANNEHFSKSSKKQEQLKEDLKETTIALNNVDAEVVALKEDLKSKERILEEVTEKAQTLKKGLDWVNTECSKAHKLNDDKSRALDSMILSLGEIAGLIFKAPKDLSGADLKLLRFKVLRVALIGFGSLQQFIWRDRSPIKPEVYRDYVQMALGEEIIDPSKTWAKDMIIAAHAKSADKSAA